MGLLLLVTPERIAYEPLNALTIYKPMLFQNLVPVLLNAQKLFGFEVAQGLAPYWATSGAGSGTAATPFLSISTLIFRSFWF